MPKDYRNIEKSHLDRGAVQIVSGALAIGLEHVPRSFLVESPCRNKSFSRGGGIGLQSLLGSLESEPGIALQCPGGRFDNIHPNDFVS